MGILRYQKRSIEEYLEEYKKVRGFKRHETKLFKEQDQKMILSASPYYEEEEKSSINSVKLQQIPFNNSFILMSSETRVWPSHD